MIKRTDMQAINGYVLLEPIKENINGFEFGSSTTNDYKKARVISSQSDELNSSEFVILVSNPRIFNFEGSQYYLVKETDIALIEPSHDKN